MLLGIFDFPKRLHILWRSVPAVTFLTTDGMPVDFPQKFVVSTRLTDYIGTNPANLIPSTNIAAFPTNPNGSVLVACNKRVRCLYPGYVARHRICNVCGKLSILLCGLQQLITQQQGHLDLRSPRNTNRSYLANQSHLLPCYSDDWKAHAQTVSWYLSTLAINSLTVTWLLFAFGSVHSVRVSSGMKYASRWTAITLFMLLSPIA